MKTLQSGYQQIVNPDGSISLVWVGTGRHDIFSNGFVGPGVPELTQIPGQGAVSLEKQAEPFSIMDFINKYWVYIALGLVAIIVLRK